MLSSLTSRKSVKKQVSPIMSIPKLIESPRESKPENVKKPLVQKETAHDKKDPATHRPPSVQNENYATPIKNTMHVVPSLADHRTRLQREKCKSVRDLRRMKRRLFLEMVEPEKQQAIRKQMNHRATDHSGKKSRTGKE